MRHALMRKLRLPFLYIHKLALRFGLQVIPDHYYSSIANMNKLRNNRAIWAKKSMLPGINYNLEEQVDLLRSVCAPYRSEYIGNRHYIEGQINNFGLGYSFIDAQALHCVIRHYKPKRVIEVGSGVSTYCTLKALEQNNTETGQQASMICIEPYPSTKLKQLPLQIIAKEVQTVPFEVFTQLQSGDVLFIDSSHTVKPGSDVNYLILEVLPRLNPGVIVHFHDIFLPYDYQRDVLTNFFQRSETSLLHAYLAGNRNIKMLFCLSGLHYEKTGELKQVFPEYNPQKDNDGLTTDIYPPFSEEKEHFPSSTYLQIL